MGGGGDAGTTHTLNKPVISRIAVKLQETSDLDANSGISYRHLSLYDVNKAGREWRGETTPPQT